MKMDEEIPPYSDIEKQNQWSILYDPALPEIFYFKYGVKASPIITFFGNHGWIHSFFNFLNLNSNLLSWKKLNQIQIH